MEKLKALLKNLQNNGISLVIFQDPITKVPSISYSLVIVSASLVVLGLIGKFAKLSGGIDIENSLSFFYGASGLYFGRKVSGNKVIIEQQDKK